MRWLAALPICLVSAISERLPAQFIVNLKPETVAAFDKYVREAEDTADLRLNGERSFLWVREKPDNQKRVMGKDPVIHAFTGNDGKEMPGNGLLHDWVGAIFVPNRKVEEVVSLLRNTDERKKHYAEVVDSKLLSRNGDSQKTMLRLKKKKYITVYLNAQYDERFRSLDTQRWHMRSICTRIAEVADAGKQSERELPPGNDHGFLWRMWTDYRFEQVNGGVVFECHSITLSRDTPAALGWIVRPLIRSIPVDSLKSVLESTRNALR